MSPTKKTSGRLFILDLGGGRVMTANPDGSNLKTLVSEGRKLPDGIVVDAEAGHLYWTNMGNPSANDGSIFRSDLDGTNVTTIVPSGRTFTPKQMQLDKKNGKLYWCDREGMRVMRANLDGGRLETLIETGHGDAGQGRILRANIEIPVGQTPSTRKDIEVLYDGLPEPIDLDLDLANRMIYWTDRGDPPRGNTVSRAPMDSPSGNRKEPKVIFTHLMEGIGLALDVKGGRMFITDLAGSVYSANLDGSNPKVLMFAQGNLTGIAYEELPVSE